MAEEMMSMSNEPASIEINVRADTFYIARRQIACWCCHAPTRLAAVVLPPFHESLSMDADEDAEEEKSLWERVSSAAFLFYIDYLPDEVRHRLMQQSPGYRRDYSAASQGSYWANHCERCDALLDDHYLYCEPEGAFAPTGPASAAEIELIDVAEPLQAAAAGYAVDPPFLEAMSKA
jgi:hypothetical protein